VESIKKSDIVGWLAEQSEGTGLGGEQPESLAGDILFDIQSGHRQ
jgi:hypothetical protein